ncbi:MAG: hydroxymethylbilane synthase, partial [Acidobacteriaceae bacterium]|nr:hydroxymethylbilane synthase [Acidobacteriaceae bacterium]
EALLAGAIDVAVNRLKDLPTQNPPGLTIAAIPKREDPRDALVGKQLAELKPGSRVGTSSSRRASQLRILCPGIVTEPIRGNVDTRLRKLAEGQFDAILLAAAGLRRLGLEHHIAHTFSAEEICPAPGQGALAVQTRSDDEAQRICAALNHDQTAAAVRCERAVLAGLGGGCQLPIGAFAEVSDRVLHVIAGVFSPDGSGHVSTKAQGTVAEPEVLGTRVAQELLDRGARLIMRQNVA